MPLALPLSLSELHVLFQFQPQIMHASSPGNVTRNKQYNNNNNNYNYNNNNNNNYNNYNTNINNYHNYSDNSVNLIVKNESASTLVLLHQVCSHSLPLFSPNCSIRQ